MLSSSMAEHDAIDYDMMMMTAVLMMTWHQFGWFLLFNFNSIFRTNLSLYIFHIDAIMWIHLFVNWTLAKPEILKIQTYMYIIKSQL